MPSSVFAKNIRWFFMRFFSERYIRLWFEKKSGGEPEMFQYKADISSCEKIVIFLPSEYDKFFILLPFAQSLSIKRMPDNFLIVSDENNRSILRAMDLERASLFYNNQTMLYGTSDFFEIEKRIQERRWDLCLFLQEKASLPFLYLARATGATYRMGVKQDFPFLNITLKNASYSDDDIYANRNFLYKTFSIDPQKAENDSIHATQKNEKLNSISKLSTANTVLLNLEPPIDGEPWSESELIALCKAFQPGWRLITIAATTAQLDIYSKVMEELDMRSNHVLLHSESIFSLLRQYPGIITLNSVHSHLFLNLSSIKVLMLEYEQDRGCIVPNNQRMIKFSRNGNFYSLAKLASDFLKEPK